MAENTEKRQFRAGSGAVAKKIGLPFVVIAAFSLLLVHHFVTRRKSGGKKLGKRSSSEEQEDAVDGELDEANAGDDSRPLSLEELRARRIRAMEARLARGVRANDPSVARLTPLGTMLELSRKVDELEMQVTSIIESRSFGSQMPEENSAALLGCLKETRVEIESVKSDESIRDIRKAQVARVDSFIRVLQGLALRFQGRLKCFSQPVEETGTALKTNLSEEELYKTSASLTQRKDASVAEWNEEMGVATVKVRKGKLWNNTGVLRKGKLLCHIEEAVFLVENGYLALEHNGAAMKLEQAFELFSVPGHGCTLEAYQVYAHLKALGYGLARHGVSWSDKGRSPVSAASLEPETQRGLRPMFNVYPPNSKFKKTDPPLHAFSICVWSNVPSRRDVKALERRSQVPVKFAVVHGKHVGIFSFSTVELQSM